MWAVPCSPEPVEIYQIFPMQSAPLLILFTSAAAPREPPERAAADVIEGLVRRYLPRPAAIWTRRRRPSMTDWIDLSVEQIDHCIALILH
jgi:hypothetical protein